MTVNWALSFLGPQFTSVQTEEAEILELTSCGSTSRTWGLPPMCLSILNSVWSLAGLGEGRVDGGDHGDWRPGRAQLSGTMKIHPLKQYLALGAGTGRAQAVLGMQVVDQLLHGISWVMAYYLIGNSSCFFPSFFFSFVFSANSTSRGISPSGEKPGGHEKTRNNQFLHFLQGA